MKFTEIFYYDETSPSCLRWLIKPSFNINIHDIAGSRNLSANEQRYRTMYLGKYYVVSRIVYSMFYNLNKDLIIDHVDGNPLNNKINNLREVTVSLNGRNRKKNNNNLSGFTGVYFHEKSNSWRAAWHELGTIKQKSFSCNKYPNAFELAKQYRNNEVEKIGGYTERHGKQ